VIVSPYPYPYYAPTYYGPSHGAVGGFIGFSGPHVSVGIGF
jgi:hypothetical protein